jgi:hypothetical protein
MDDFKGLLLLDRNNFTKKLSEIDSANLIDFLKKCDDKRIKKEYYSRIEKILGKNYLKFIKIAVNYRGSIAIKNFIIKCILFFLNIIFSNIFCIILFVAINKMPLDYYIYGFFEILTLSILGFIFSIFPQIVVCLFLHFIKKIIKLRKIVELVIVIIIGIIMSFLFLAVNPGRAESIKDVVFYGYSVYIPIIISGIIFRILLYKINKINIRKKQ